MNVLLPIIVLISLFLGRGEDNDDSKRERERNGLRNFRTTKGTRKGSLGERKLESKIYLQCFFGKEIVIS